MDGDDSGSARRGNTTQHRIPSSIMKGTATMQQSSSAVIQSTTYRSMDDDNDDWSCDGSSDDDGDEENPFGAMGTNVFLLEATSGVDVLREDGLAHKIHSGANGDDADEEGMVCFERNWTPRWAPCKSSVTFDFTWTRPEDPGDAESEREEEGGKDETKDQRGPRPGVLTLCLNGDGGVQIYDAAVVLSGFLFREARVLLSSSTRVLELGSGTGFCGLFAAYCCPYYPQHVVLTDRDTRLDQLRENVQRNEKLRRGKRYQGGNEETAKCTFAHNNRRVEVCELEWGKGRYVPPRTSTSNANQVAEPYCFDLILCSDLLYTEALFEPLLRTIKLHCHPSLQSEEQEDDGDNKDDRLENEGQATDRGHDGGEIVRHGKGLGRGVAYESRVKTVAVAETPKIAGRNSSSKFHEQLGTKWKENSLIATLFPSKARDKERGMLKDENWKRTEENNNTTTRKWKERKRTLVLCSFERRSRRLKYDDFIRLARERFGFEVVEVPAELQHPMAPAGWELGNKQEWELSQQVGQRRTTTMDEKEGPRKKELENGAKQRTDTKHSRRTQRAIAKTKIDLIAMFIP